MDNVPVTQADREAAWLLRPSCYFDHDKEAWMNGRYDSHYTIQALARHRIAALESAAASLKTLAEKINEIDDEPNIVTLAVITLLAGAKEIRALKEPTNEAE